jgi:hypothetical protein
MEVRDFLYGETLSPFAWGNTDCASTADRWFKIIHGYSPLQLFGRTVMNEELGRAWLAQPGGLVRGIKDVMRYARIVSLHGTPVAGDIGVIVVDGRACIAIFDGDLWQSRDEDGLIFANDTHRFVAWEVAICHRH